MNIFKKGDVIVSGFGNVRIFTDECYGGDNYACLAPYVESDAPAGTDMKYARLATSQEQKKFFALVERNGLIWNPKTCTIKAGENYNLAKIKNLNVGKYKGEPMPYKVVKKRVRATLTQVRDLESKNAILEDKLKKALTEVLNYQDVKNELIQARHDVTLLQERLQEHKTANDKLDCVYQETKEKLERQEVEMKTLAQSNTLMEQELKRLRSANASLNQLNDNYKSQIFDLESRGFWARVFNW